MSDQFAFLTGKGTFQQWVATEELGVDLAQKYVRLHPSDHAYVVKIMREFDAKVEVNEVARQ